jgi:hypothetical protein
VLRRVGTEAFLMVIRQFWPARGTRNEAAMALARVLLEAMAARYPNTEELIATVDALVVATAMAGGDGEESRDGKERASNTLEKMKAGEVTIGMTRLLELLELPNDVAKTFWRWLGMTRVALAAMNAVGAVATDFYSYMPSSNYIFAPTREMWPTSSVNKRLPPVMIGGKPMPASKWSDKNQPVEQMTWAPGFPMLIRDRLISNGGWIEREGMTCFNLYRPPTIELGDAHKADTWISHVHKLFPTDADHIIQWLAQRVQHPQEKINHALVLGSNEQGIGKDTMLEPVKRAVGPWNFDEIGAQQLLGRFNGFLKSVILRVSEARDLGNVTRFQLYDHTKAYTAAPPDVLRVDEKNLREYSIFNCVGLIFTSNYKTDGIYLPAEDRRHYVAWSDLLKKDFEADYWPKLWRWYADGGFGHVAAYLTELDISKFDPKAPPPKTAAFWTIVNANRPSEEGEFMDLIQGPLGNPDAMTMHQLIAAATNNFELGEWLSDRRNHRTIPHRLEKCGYVPVYNDAETEGRWKIGGRSVVVYAKKTLSVREQIAAVNALKKRTEELLLSNPH